jgi:hypothetical protein
MALKPAMFLFADKLDGLKHDMKKHTQVSSKASMEDLLQVADEYFAKQMRDPGKKRVTFYVDFYFPSIFSVVVH